MVNILAILLCVQVAIAADIIQCEDFITGELHIKYTPVYLLLNRTVTGTAKTNLFTTRPAWRGEGRKRRSRIGWPCWGARGEG